jgi:hypothetical protein
MGSPPAEAKCLFNLTPNRAEPLFAWLQEKGSEAERAGRRLRPASILAVGDPVFEAPHPSASPAPPEHGILVAAVVPGSNAAGSGIKAGDVLLRYSNKKLNAPADLIDEEAAQPGGTPRGAASIVVRGVQLLREPLGVVVRSCDRVGPHLSHSQHVWLTQGAKHFLKRRWVSIRPASINDVHVPRADQELGIEQGPWLKWFKA